jgi:predicted phage-related endonuclease
MSAEHALAVLTPPPTGWELYVRPPEWAEISTITPNSPEWLAKRERRLGASEAADVLGVPDAYGTAADVWRRKCGFPVSRAFDVDALRQGFGHAAETVIAQILADEHGGPVLPGPWILDRYTPLSGFVDLVMLYEGARAFVECKITWAGTNPYAGGATPDRTAIQQILYAALGGFEVAILCVVANENFGPKLERRIEPVEPKHLRAADIIREQLLEWWEKHVKGLRPPPDASASDWARYEALVHGLREERAATEEEEASAATWIALRGQRAALEKEEAAARDHFAALTEGRAVRGNGWIAKAARRAAGVRQVTVQAGTFYGLWETKPRGKH